MPRGKPKLGPSKSSQPAKRAKVAYPCRVCSHDCLDEQAGIMCDGCQTWMHQECIGMTMSDFVHFSLPHLQFFCFQCSHLAYGGFNCLASLSRIAACRPDVVRMRESGA